VDEATTAHTNNKRSLVVQKRLIVGPVVILLVIFGAWIVSQGTFRAADTDQIWTQVNPQKRDSISKPATDTDEEIVGGPEIFLPETTHDFGTVSQNTKQTYKFIVKNIGDAPLKLIKAKGS
jgi:hypothetical protein